MPTFDLVQSPAIAGAHNWRLQRWTGLSGLAFVLGFVAAAGSYGTGAGSSQPEIVAFYGNAANRAHQIEGFAILLVASLLLMLYVVVLRHRLVLDPMLGALATISGTTAVVLLMLANTFWAATAFTFQIQSFYAVS